MPEVSTAEKTVKIHFTVAKALSLSLSVPLNNISVSPAEFSDDQDIYCRQSMLPYLCSSCHVDSWKTVAEN